MYCKKCGNQLNESDKFCNNCGEPNGVQSVETSNNQPSKKSNKTIIIIISLIVAVAAGVAVWYFIFNDSDKKDKSSDESKTTVKENKKDTKLSDIFDDDVINDDKNDDKDDDKDVDKDSLDSDSTITYKNFKFKKLAGYSYEESANGLQVSNNSSLIILNIIDGSFDLIKARYEDLSPEFEKKGYHVEKLEIKSYGGVEYVVAEVKQNGLSMLLLYGKADSSHIYVIVLANKSYTIDYSLIYKANLIIKNAYYVY